MLSGTGIAAAHFVALAAGKEVEGARINIPDEELPIERILCVRARAEPELLYSRSYSGEAAEQ